MYGLVATVICVSLSFDSTAINSMGYQNIRYCPNIPVAKDFNAARYVGRWYEQEKFPFPLEDGFKCSEANYTLNDDGSIKIVNSGEKITSGKTEFFEATATVGKERNPAKLTVNFQSPGGQRRGKYWVLATDYITYSLVWSCTETDTGLRELSWIISRKRSGLCSKQVEKLKAILRDYGVDTSRFEQTDQTKCSEDFYDY